ncbi:class I SAM-dependent methyltransferase [Culicoidibacter larvae]|uniref:class I SAM-dependent methyltransferase n=1 Tax=Culicoidibacter larvae TaxID=2579976 RepID=UPI001484F147|nr:methyltransferase domain-containing protein [Culicoidibacter larvae]
MNIFDNIATKYDNPERIVIADLIAGKIAQYLPNNGETTGTAADVGCGTGLIGLQLANHFQQLTLIDASQKMLDIVEQKIATLALGNAKTVYSDLHKPLDNISFDVIFMSQVLLHVPDTEPFLNNIYQMLNPGGKLLIVDFDKNPAIIDDRVHNGFDQDTLHEVLKKLGFHNPTSETFYYGERNFMNQDASMFIMQAQK